MPNSQEGSCCWRVEEVKEKYRERSEFGSSSRQSSPIADPPICILTSIWCAEEVNLLCSSPWIPCLKRVSCFFVRAPQACTQRWQPFLAADSKERKLSCHSYCLVLLESRSVGRGRTKSWRWLVSVTRSPQNKLRHSSQRAAWLCLVVRLNNISLLGVGYGCFFFRVEWDGQLLLCKIKMLTHEPD